MTVEAKFCKNCQFFIPVPWWPKSFAMCGHSSARHPVSGKPMCSCVQMRADDGACMGYAILFEDRHQ